MKCINCKTANAGEANFCKNCGWHLKSVADMTASTVPGHWEVFKPIVKWFARICAYTFEIIISTVVSLIVLGIAGFVFLKWFAN